MILWPKKYLSYKSMIAGVDEVGRGCLAGPVIAASVILKRPIKGLMDSKNFPQKKGEFESGNNRKFHICNRSCR